MKNSHKTKQQLLNELIEMRQRIMEFKALEAKHTETKELYTTLISGLPIGVYITQDRKFAFVNPAFLKDAGFTEDELIGTDPLMIVHHEDRELVRQNALEMLKGRRSTPYEYRSVNKAGEIRWVMETVTSIQYQGRRATLGNYIDTTKHKQAEEQLKESLEKLRKVLGETVNTLAVTAEMRDRYTAGHQQRVTQLACAIAKEMNLSKEMIEEIRVAGTLHDIGKMNIPSEILAKPHKLTEAEFNMIKTHSKAGYDILKTIDFHGRLPPSCCNITKGQMVRDILRVYRLMIFS